jgi:hypothetical protein
MARKRKRDPEAAARLREWLKPGDTVYCILRHKSASGMQRIIQLVKWDKEADRFLFLGYNAAAALGWTYSDSHEGVKVDGAGMDMGFHLVYTLAAVLFDGNGYALESKWL